MKLKFDTLHLVIKDWESCIEIRNLDHFSKMLIRKNIAMGFSSLQFVENDSGTLLAIRLQISSKILKAQSFDGINRGNIELVIDALNRSQDHIFIFDKSQFLSTTKVSRADVFHDQISEKPTSTIIDELMLIKAVSRYKTCSYDNMAEGRKNGYTIRVKKKEHFVCYDKKKEICRGKDDIHYKNFNQSLEYTRFEYQIQDSKNIKNYFGSANLIDLMNSQSDPLKDFLSNFKSSLQKTHNLTSREVDPKIRAELFILENNFNNNFDDYMNHKKNQLNRNQFYYFKKSTIPTILKKIHSPRFDLLEYVINDLERCSSA